ncbi:MAG: MoxR family ATPase [Cyanobacteria bacterium REEB67]|nr:MoxR family ATPase [Cyanobacteria bacterium REEB67]
MDQSNTTPGAMTNPAASESVSTPALPSIFAPPPHPGEEIISKSRLLEFGQSMAILAEELKEIFPERGDLIEQIIHALVTREHVLIHGDYGTGKSDLVTALFSCFTTPAIFSIALNKFMSESHVIGVPDPKEMREQGRLHYQRDGGILDAEFVELDEIFDANAPLLRVLLGILNERKFKRGRQTEEARLHSAIASTNGDPETVLKNAPELGAVIDRFIYICKVGYLTQADSRRAMYAKFVEDRKPKMRIAFEDLVAASELAVGRTIKIDAEFLAVYDEVIQAYKKSQEKTRVVISDRRANKLLKTVRAAAILHGRYDVALEDIYAIRWGLCTGNVKAQHEAFMNAARPIIEKAETARQQSFDDMVKKLLEQYEASVPVIPASATDGDLVSLLRQVNGQIKQVGEVKPQLASNQDRKAKLVTRLNTMSKQLNERINGLGATDGKTSTAPVNAKT